MKRSRAGFTLLEILTTIAIFGILVTITGYVYASALSRSRDQQRLSDLQSISNGLEQYYLDHKTYPTYGENTNKLFLAKFQLEPFANCQINGSHDFLVPTYMSTIPEDPRAKFVVIGNSSNCDAENTQKRQYLYIPVVATTVEAVKNFELLAKVERLSNVSTNSPAASAYTTLIPDYLFCTQGGIDPFRPDCSHNFHLGPKKNN